jgi:hypothetical protein
MRQAQAAPGSVEGDVDVQPGVLESLAPAGVPELESPPDAKRTISALSFARTRTAGRHPTLRPPWAAPRASSSVVCSCAVST